MGAMVELNPNGSKCRDISLKLCWPHLDEEGAHTYCDSAPFLTGTADSEAASIISGYDAWCELMSNTSTGAPMYQWTDLNDPALNFLNNVY